MNEKWYEIVKNNSQLLQGDLIKNCPYISVDVEALNSLAKSNGDRLRVNSPYREHLSQAFARYFMRVGLPSNIPPFR